MQNFKDLENLGIIQAKHPQDLDLDKGSYTFYAGFDPTSDSLHVGSLFLLITMKKLADLGHTPIAVVGGATGMIGDPSGKSAERNLLGEKEIQHNVRGMQAQITKFFSKQSNVKVLNNLDWIGNFSLIPFLRDVGKSFRVTEMLAKDSVQSRIESEEGISFTEFTYQILQAYDFLHLHQEHKCNLQVGGSDQWGNISAGITLVRKHAAGDVCGLTFPLIESAPGQKFGKSEGRNVWLDPQKTSPYEFYQFWIQTTDEMVIPYLGYFTNLSPAEIDHYKEIVSTSPEDRQAQKKLAYEVTRLVHGDEEVEKSIKASEVLFGGSPEGLGDQDLMNIFANVPSRTYPREVLKEGSLPLVQVLCETDLCKSRGQARNLIKQGGVYLNNARVDDDALILSGKDLASESMLILRAGKRKYGLLSFVG